MRTIFCLFKSAFTRPVFSLSLLAALIMLVGCDNNLQSAEPADSAPLANLSAFEACEQLSSMSIPASVIALPTTGASVHSATLVAADADGNNNGEYCQVLGAIHPVNYNAPDINFELNLPSNWNRKSLQFGGGGLNGVLITG